MAKDDDAGVLAERYFDLWQEQLARLVADPSAAQNLMTLFGMLGNSVQPPADAGGAAEAMMQQMRSAMTVASGWAAKGGADGGGTSGDSGAGGSAGTQADRSSSELDTAVLVELMRRVSRLEERLDSFLDRYEKDRDPGSAAKG